MAETVGVWAIFRYVSLSGAFFAALIPVVLALACYKTLVEALTWKAEIDIVKRLDCKQNAVAVRDWLMKELWKA